MCPQVQWKDQFKVMKEKMIESIAKLNNTEIKPYLMHLYFNACSLKKVFFGCGVIKITNNQDKELRKLHETTLAKKLRLGSNFLRAAMHSRKSAVGIGLMKPKTVIAILACKLCVGNVRAKTKIGKIVRMQEESLMIEHGRVWKGVESCTKKPEAWTEEVNELLTERNLTIRNDESRVKFTKNVTMMDEAVRHAKMNGLGEECVDQINHVRLHKKLLLPVELVGASGKMRTEAFDKFNKASQIK